ncbi:probable LRR receptor-like serine/threonine-protein kinase At4g29180 [Lolium perenne]|uniref:probable LRR receptor-like serine/threonine-protein kinase At4g29180 n=1 Tax=Lolium perenne TaxID=4522 RepID=UPI0021F518D4|nr:putative leucine-rich repeat receptor-like serine/threonine-protein kinase At2g04300 [Lolium perenne]
MGALVLFAAFLLAATAVHVAGQEGFLSIDCGLDAALSGRLNTDTQITYVSDGPYVDGGENHEIGDVRSAGDYTDLRTLRSFPSGLRNCYTLPTVSGAKYLVRTQVFYGNYDGKNDSSSVQFELYLGTNFWDKVENVSYWPSEAVFVAWASWVPVCLINTGNGAPFVNTVELRQLGPSLYPDVNTDQFMCLCTYDRRNLGATSFTRFPNDRYDRFWWSVSTSSSWAYLSTQNTIAQQDQALQEST